MGKYFSEIIFFNELAMFVAKVKFFFEANFCSVALKDK